MRQVAVEDVDAVESQQAGLVEEVPQVVEVAPITEGGQEGEEHRDDEEEEMGEEEQEDVIEIQTDDSDEVRHTPGRQAVPSGGPVVLYSHIYW